MSALATVYVHEETSNILPAYFAKSEVKSNARASVQLASYNTAIYFSAAQAH